MLGKEAVIACCSRYYTREVDEENRLNVNQKDMYSQRELREFKAWHLEARLFIPVTIINALLLHQ